MSTATETIEQLATKEYKYGFVTDIEADTFPPGLNEDVVRVISAQEDEPEWLLEWRLKAYRAWLTMTEPTWPNVHYPPDRLPGDHLLLGAEEEAGARTASTRSIRSCARRSTSSASRSTSRSCSPASPWTRCSTASRSRPRSGASSRSWASSSARSARPCASIPSWCSKYLGSVVPYTDNFFATLNSAVFSDGCFVLHPEGRALPDGAVHLLPHQRRRARASSSAR